jgi:hypothetical protein
MIGGSLEPRFRRVLQLNVPVGTFKPLGSFAVRFVPETT